MKHLKNNIGYLILLFLVILSLGSCTKNFETVNAPPEGAQDASIPALFNGVISSLPLASGEYSVMNSWMYPITQQAIVTSGAYPYENGNKEIWSNYYYTL